MKTADIIARVQPAKAWTDGEKIPWNDPEFSERMLRNHLSQDHDWASRRRDIIQRQLKWISASLPSSAGCSILDLACGPGFYTQHLAGLGHKCTGVDFSPASIAYAREQAGEKKLSVDYVLSDIRQYQTDQTFDCVMLVFGEFNVFSERDALSILANSSKMLKPGGLFILEAHTFEAVKETGLAPASWWTCRADEGILSAKPHLCLQENFWDEKESTATTRYFVVDAATDEAKMFSSSMTAYTMGRYDRILTEAGFSPPRVLPVEDWPVGGPFEGVMMTLVSHKQ